MKIPLGAGNWMDILAGSDRRDGHWEIRMMAWNRKVEGANQMSWQNPLGELLHKHTAT